MTEIVQAVDIVEIKTDIETKSKTMQQKIIYEDKEIFIEKEESQIPWLKIFTQTSYKELTEMPKSLREKVWNTYYIIEEEMLVYYKPKKINMASFANMLPRVHIHVMARFEDDSYYPNPMWGEKLRESVPQLPDEEEFFRVLRTRLTKS